VSHLFCRDPANGSRLPLGLRVWLRQAAVTAYSRWICNDAHLNTITRRLPIALTGVRALLAPVVVVLAIAHPSRAAFGVCLTIGFVSDVFDGILARRLKVVTANLRRLDSVTDTIFYLAIGFSVWHLHAAVIIEHMVALIVLGILEAGRYGLDLYKFGREASYHMWTSKLWGIALFIGCFSVLALGSDGVAVTVAVYLGMVADIEGLVISTIIPEWKNDVPTFVHAWRDRVAHRSSAVRAEDSIFDA
jgi:phosphatidylglycerophosphate synthase